MEPSRVEKTPGPKKRGRKPVGKVKQIQNISNIKNDQECIIAHIPIKLTNDDDSQSDLDSSIKTLISHDIAAEPTDPTDHANNNLISNNNMSFEDAALECDNDGSIHSDDSDLNNDIFVTGNISTMSENETLKEKKINELRKTIEILHHKLKNKNTEKRRQIFQNTANVKTCNKHTKQVNSKCWHCVHEFEGDAIGLPEKYYNNTFHVFGLFCSFNCALKYNVDIKDLKTWDRTSLLHMMYNDYNVDKCQKPGADIETHKIQPAPPREQLDVFGGPFTIEEFRNISTNNKSYRTILPPMVSITPLIEEDYRLKCNLSVTSTNIPIDQDVLDANKTLKLKREKPLITSQYSLEKTMGIKRKPTII